MNDRQAMLPEFKRLIKEYPPPTIEELFTLLNSDEEFKKNRMRYFETQEDGFCYSHTVPGNQKTTWNFVRIQNYFENVRKICDELEKTFNVRVFCSSYYSPESSQAFPAHFDAYDLFGVQVFGSKKWKIWPQLPESVYDKELTPAQGPIISDWIPRFQPEVMVANPGDVFYVAARRPHEVIALDSDSFSHMFAVLDADSKFVDF